MKAPLFHREISVTLVDSIPPDKEEGESYVYGVTHAENGIRIELARDVAADADFTETTLHELLHAIEITCGMSLSHDVVHILAGGLTQMLVGLKLVHPPTWRATLETQQALEAKDGK